MFIISLIMLLIMMENGKMVYLTDKVN